MHANLIIDRLWIGDWQSAHDYAFLKKNGITVILNMTKDIQNKFPTKIEYSRVALDDSLKQEDYDIMTKTLKYTTEFIHKHRDIDNKSVLVHCHQGMQRSCAAVLGYLLKYQPELAPSVKKGAKFIQSKRPEAWHHGGAINFDQSLEKYYNKEVKPFKPVKIVIKKSKEIK